MKERIFKLYGELKNNKKNTICFFRHNKRFEKTFSEFASDVELSLSKLNYLRNKEGTINIAIIGPVSYDWIVCDMACIKGGFLSIAVPETLPKEKVLDILKETKADAILMDCSLKDKYSIETSNVFYFECNEESESESDFWKLPEFISDRLTDNLILEDFSIVFSSGTSEKIKHIKKTFPTHEKKKETFKDQLKKIGQYINYKRSFWSKKDNKLIIFMPFSHPQQRGFFRTALFNKFDIILSDPLNCLKHIILEKPNIMISVPLVYEAMANRIKVKIERFNSNEKFWFNIFNKFCINRLSNINLIKKIIAARLFKKIKPIYGGRADYFVTGSAPISPEVIRIFYSIGVKIFEAYGQSETGNIGMNTSKNFKIGSVGKPLREVKISEESEILVKYDSKLNGSNKDILDIDSEEFIHTGDLGYIDKDGFIFLTGRKDDVIVLESGKKIFPEKVENEFKNFELVRNAFIFSADGYKLNVVLDCNSQTDDINIKKIINEVNSRLMTHEKIEKFHMETNLLTVENGMLTSTFKKKRNKIKEYVANKEFINLF